MFAQAEPLAKHTEFAFGLVSFSLWNSLLSLPTELVISGSPHFPELSIAITSFSLEESCTIELSMMTEMFCIYTAQYGSHRLKWLLTT